MGVHTSIWRVVMPLPMVFAAKVVAFGTAMLVRLAFDGCTLATAAGHTTIDAQMAAMMTRNSEVKGLCGGSKRWKSEYGSLAPVLSRHLTTPHHPREAMPTIN